MRTLVVYYSRSGTTRRAAEQIAARLGADLEPIADRTRREGRLGYVRCGYEATFGKTPEIGPSVFEPAAYDLVVIGTPVWNASMSSPVRSYVQRHRAALPAVAFFCTCGGSGGRRVFAQLARACGKDPRATLILREVDVVRWLVGAAVDGFARELQPIAPPVPTAPPPDAHSRT